MAKDFDIDDFLKGFGSKPAHQDKGLQSIQEAIDCCTRCIEACDRYIAKYGNTIPK